MFVGVGVRAIGHSRYVVRKQGVVTCVPVVFVHKYIDICCHTGRLHPADLLMLTAPFPCGSCSKRCLHFLHDLDGCNLFLFYCIFAPSLP